MGSKIMQVTIFEDGRLTVCDWRNDIFGEFFFSEVDGDVYDLLFESEGENPEFWNGKESIDGKETPVKIVENTIEQHNVYGAVGKERLIFKGRCKHCGSNRLEFGRTEPEGIAYVKCPVCRRDNMSEPELEWGVP